MAEMNRVFTMETVPLKFGWGALDEIGHDLAALGLRRVLLLTDPGVAAAGHAERVAERARTCGVEVVVWDGVRSEPTDASWREAIAFAREGAWDGFIGLGGGSAIDTAKAVNLYTTHPADLMAYINRPLGDGRPVPGPLKPLVAIPTTAGTGSETTSVAVLDLLERKVKTGVSHRHLRPRLAVVDPQTTLTLPPAVTASCGLDVLCHALESYTSLPYDRRPAPADPAQRPAYVGANPVSDLWAAEAIRLGARWLARAYHEPGDREARTRLMLAATYAGMGFGNAGVHLPHAMSYPIAGLVRGFRPRGWPGEGPLVPHGISVALGTPASFRHLGPHAPERTREALRHLGGDAGAVAPEEAGAALAEWMTALLRELELPNGLAEVGYTAADIPALVEGTLAQQRLLVNAPVAVDAALLEAVFRDSLRLW
ncbi:hydroxyacid-oxoacid transhydrogenase [Inmirania thermothiophila]|uniref:hydroxyacid-oxoacid transhydrogenase n=1 Tax=Inmirania thermothiophila TaxID=1750597 RepID=A0A3N1Y8P4_9GAMM|nr:hydroxyacid-oxoacid transhydrogenase [Inmirania thermothiophila]ROR35184.1 hydroxyacid-oxoacid transhydrogenase [Inmirania thermothiophila]